MLFISRFISIYNGVSDNTRSYAISRHLSQNIRFFFPKKHYKLFKITFYFYAWGCEVLQVTAVFTTHIARFSLLHYYTFQQPATPTTLWNLGFILKILNKIVCLLSLWSWNAVFFHLKGKPHSTWNFHKHYTKDLLDNNLNKCVEYRLVSFTNKKKKKKNSKAFLITYRKFFRTVKLSNPLNDCNFTTNLTFSDWNFIRLWRMFVESRLKSGTGIVFSFFLALVLFKRLFVRIGQKSGISNSSHHEIFKFWAINDFTKISLNWKIYFLYIYFLNLISFMYPGDHTCFFQNILSL